MDTIKILLGATAALLLGALVVSWKNFQRDERNEPPAELAKIEAQIKEIHAEQDRLREERKRIMTGEVAAPVVVEEKVTELAELPQTDASFGADAVGPTPDDLPDIVDQATPEADDPTAGQPATAPTEADRAAAIKSAPAVAKVGEWVEDGGFAVVEVLSAEAVKPDTILCLRRNSGILGRLKVSEITPEGAAIVNAVTQFTGPKPQAGDELIAEPK